MTENTLSALDVDPTQTTTDIPRCNLAAIMYGERGGWETDRLMTALARRLTTEGIRLAGAVQHNLNGESRSCCDMILEDLGSGRRVKISEDRGPDAKGCRLDTSALEVLAGLAATTLDEGADLLIINKFGKRESEGGGFRETINTALEKGITVIAAVNHESASYWAGYAQGLDTRLPRDLDAALNWCRKSLQN